MEPPTDPFSLHPVFTLAEVLFVGNTPSQYTAEHKQSMGVCAYLDHTRGNTEQFSLTLGEVASSALVRPPDSQVGPGSRVPTGST